MNLPETIFIPTASEAKIEILSSRPYKLILEKDHLEYFKWEKIKGFDEDSGMTKTKDIDYVCLMKKDRIENIDLGFDQEKDLYSLDISSRANTLQIYFHEKKDGKAIYDKLKTWWLCS